MKLNSRSFAKPLRWRATQVVALSTFALALQVACSDEPQPSNPPNTPGRGGSSAGTTSNASGTTSTAGTFGMAGTATGGASGGTGGASGGTGGTTAGTANGGTGGTGVPPVDCSKEAGKALPIPLSSAWGFPDSGEDSVAEAPLADMCAPDAPEGAAECWSIVWTPVKRTFVHWYWHPANQHWTGPGVCVAAGAKAVTLKARADSAVAAEFQAAGVKKVVNLTTDWQDVVIDLSGVTYNTVYEGGGVNAGLVVVMTRVGAADVAKRSIFFYDVKWVAEIGGGGGEGGAGGADG